MDFDFSAPINTLLESISFIFNSIAEWVISFFDYPILLIGVGLFIAFSVVGLIYRLMHG